MSVLFLNVKTRISNPFQISRNRKIHQGPTVYYLINSCGLPPGTALSTAKKVRLNTTEKPDSVITLFKDQGLTEAQIKVIISKQPELFVFDPNKILKPKIEFLHDMGVSGTMFVYAIQAMATMTKSNWKGKFAVYQSLSLSEDEVVSMFKRQPLCMTMSKEKIQRGFEFFMEKLKWSPPDIALQPELLSFSLERRIVLRCAVLKILNSKGAIRKKLKWTTVFTMAEKKFLDRFVMKYHETIPEVVKAYKGGIEFAGFEDVGRV